ncbi:MAG: endonuclease MutS2 [Oscillospiraceae bacterium]|nr:endonuclease MutS2 [Oscillospiraceae bacterium]MCL2278033.1 endonuclease MutS2 [Oscillospiraceae bacterium]
MTFFEKSLKILELPDILTMLAAEAVSECAKDAAAELRPYVDAETVKANLSETTAAKNMMILRQSPPFSSVRNIKNAVKRADMGGALSTKELLNIAGLIRASSASIAYYKSEKNAEKTAIDYLFNSLNPDKFLENKISASIVSEEEISDNASPELATIRRHIRLSHDKIRQTLNKIITSSAYSKMLQEPIITMRNDRYVVPVKAEHKSGFPGMVHDISSSGATQFIEPMSVVNINNELRELSAREKTEIERILMELSADVANCGDDIIRDYEVLTKLDFVFAKAKLSYKMDAIEPEIMDDIKVRINAARHPLLPKETAVPIDIRLGGDFDTLVITGPNTGGKTVSLKTLGLLCAMSQCGLHIPCNHGSYVPVFGSIFSDIGDEQSIEQSLSTFSSHMTNIVSILKHAGHDSLLMFDELGAGTDPIEGAALAISIIEYARKTGALIAATTHYAELKSYAVTSQGVSNASCEFDVETLRPTYKLIIGIPGKSNAFAISKRLGLSDDIINDAKNRLSSDNASFEDALLGLEESRLSLEKERDEITKLHRDASSDRNQAAALKARLDKELAAATDRARSDASKIIEEARLAANSVMDELNNLRKKAINDVNMQKLGEDKADLLRKLNEAEYEISDSPDTQEDSNEVRTRDIVPGDRVKLRSIGTLADVVSVGNDGTLSLRAGILNVTARPNEVILVQSENVPELKKQIAKSEAKLRSISAKPELDIRGMNVDEALPIMERFIDNAKMAKLNTVSIIHGKGTGILRKAVHKSLKRDNHAIKSFRLGVYGEGEDGVTIVSL